MSPIAKLITDRCLELGISYSELVRRCGYTNRSKGLRRLLQLLEGNATHSKAIALSLPAALSIDAAIVEDALRETQDRACAKLEAVLRMQFKPHAVILCERSTPEPLFVAAVIGIDRILRIDFAEGSAPLSYVTQGLTGVSQKLAKWNSSSLPAFGRPKSIVVNYSCDWAVEFGLEGKPVRVFDKAVWTGVSMLALSGREISSRELDRIIGPSQESAKNKAKN